MSPRAKIIPFPGPGRGRRSPPPGAGEPGDDGLVEVHRCDQAEALVVKSLLESEEIPTLLRSRLLMSVHPFSVGDQGEIVVLAPAADAARARILLAAVHRRRA